MSTEYSLSEVKKHKSSKSLWIVIHNDVYDVTSFLSEHPGGEDTLLDSAGLDATQAFEEVGHSEDARELLKKYKIGKLPKSEKVTCVTDDQCCQKCSPLSLRLPCPGCPSESLSKSSSKSWRTFDGKPSRGKKPSKPKVHHEPKAERRVDAVIVPTERRRPRPCGGGSKLKWALLALAGAIIIGVIIHKSRG